MRIWLLYALWLALGTAVLSWQHDYEPQRAWCLSNFYAHIDLPPCAPMRELLEAMRGQP